MGESPDPTSRISDAERDLAVTALWEHLGTSRLTTGEHEKRCALAAAATTKADLDALFADLPAPRPALSAAAELEKSTAGESLAFAGGMVLTFGTAAAIVLTAMYGLWWMFLAVGGLTSLFFVLSNMAYRRRRD